MIQTSTKYVNNIIKYGLTRKKYEVLDEIHATQSFTYIDTGVYCTSDISVEVKYKSETSHNSGFPRVFAGNAEWNDSQSFHVYYHLGELAYKFIGETDQHYTGIYTDTNEHIIHMSSTEITFDGTVLGTQQDPHISGSKNLLLLAKRSTRQDEQGFFPIYYFKVWDGNTLIRDLIPVKRLSDAAIGMYDRVNNVFYGSATSNSFSYTSLQTPEYITEFDNTEYHINRIYLNGEVYWGNDHVPAPTATYEILESIITPSSALIDTLYTASENTVVEMTMKMPTNYGNNSHNYRLMTTYDPTSVYANGFWGSPGTWGLQFERSNHVLSIAQLGRSNSVYNSTISFSSLSGYKYRYVVTAKGVCTIYDMNDTVVYSFDAGYTSGTVSQTTITFFTTKGVNTPIYDDTLAGNEFYGGKLCENNVLLRDFVPVRRLSDDAIGLYDYVSGGFFENLLGTTFSYVAKSTPEYI